MAVIYYRELRLPEGETVGLEESIHSRCKGLLKRILDDFQTFGMFKSSINFVYLGETDGVYYAKTKLRVMKDIFSTMEDEFSSYHKDDLHLHIKSYIDSVNKGIVIFITDKDKGGMFSEIILDIKKSLHIKRKAEIIL